MLVCLDPGHHLKSVNRSPDGTYYEWEFAQDVADRAERMIARIPGLDCIKTKEKDTYPTSLQGRVETAQGSDLFLSIHSNAFGSGWTSPRGVGYYVYPGRNYRLAQKARMIGQYILPFNDRGIRERNFYVLRETTMPSLLYEFGFHTNRDDVELLKLDSTRQACAEVVVRTACMFLGIEYVEDDAMRHIVVSGDRLGRISQANNLTLDEIMKYNPHIEDANFIVVGDIVYLAQPSEAEKELAALNRRYIIETENLQKDLEHCREQYAQVSSALKIANNQIDKKRLLIADLESRIKNALKYLTV